MSSNKDRSVVLTTGGLQALVRSPLSKVEGIILWHLVNILPVSGDVIYQTQLASDLAITTVHISRAIKRLCTAGFLMRGVKIAHSYHYKLNPAYIRIM